MRVIRGSEMWFFFGGGGGGGGEGRGKGKGERKWGEEEKGRGKKKKKKKRKKRILPPVPKNTKHHHFPFHLSNAPPQTQQNAGPDNIVVGTDPTREKDKKKCGSRRKQARCDGGVKST